MTSDSTSIDVLLDPADLRAGLRATRTMTVRLPALDLVISFAEGEELRTEISAKFRRAGIEAELAAAGLRLERWWTDAADDYALTLARRV